MGARLGWLLFAIAWPAWVSASSGQGVHEVDGSAGRHVKAADSGVPAAPRVRGGSPVLAEAIDLLSERSPTFQKLVTTINGTDGIVYVNQGTCRYRVPACLLLAVTRAGRYRVLHIVVDGRKTGNTLLVAIGHELQHAIELLGEPGVVDGATALLFYERIAPTYRDFYETQAAIETGSAIARQLREWTRKRGRQDGARTGRGVMR
jgi:hypothetical protein